MKKQILIFSTIFLFVMTCPQNINAQTQDLPSIISAEVNTNTELDYNSAYHLGNSFGGNFIQGFFQTMIEDIAFDISFSTGNVDRKIKKITVNNGVSVWSTFIREGMPLIVYSDGVRIIDSWQPEIRTFSKNKIHKVTLFAQPVFNDLYSPEFWTSNNKGFVKIYFTDGTEASITKFTVASVQKNNLAKPIIEKAEIVNDSNFEILNEKGSLSSIGIPGDVVIDLVLNMNGTNKTISYMAIKKSSRSINLWSTNQNGKSGAKTEYVVSVDPRMGTWVQPYGLLVMRNNQKLNDPNIKNVLTYLGTYSGQTKINFILYADKYAGPDFTEDSELYVVFTDGTIISKNISISKNELKPLNTDPVIKKVTLSDNNSKNNLIRESLYGDSNYWLWDIDLDLKNRSRNISYVLISMRNQRWSTDELYGSLLNIYDNGKVISNSSKKVLGSLGLGTKKLSIYGKKVNDQRYDIDDFGTVYIVFDDGFVITYSLSGEMVKSILKDSDIEFPALPQYPYLSYGYNSDQGLILEWEPSTDNVGVAGYKIYRAERITPARGQSYDGPFIEVGDTKNTYFVGQDSKIDKSKYYAYYVRAYDLEGNLSYPYPTTYLKINDLISRKYELIVDKEKPSAPSLLIAKFVHPDHINLTWKDSVDDTGVRGYRIYRDGVLISTTTLPKFNDYSIKSGNLYTYNVSAYDKQMNESVLSSYVTGFYPNDNSTISTKDLVAPTAPYNLTTRVVSNSKIDFSWSPSTDNVGVAGYKVYRDEKEISSTKGTSYSDTGLQPGAPYSYYIRAFDAAGNISQKSSYLTEFTQNSATVTSSKDTQAPSYPPNLNIRAISSSQLEISWSPSTDNVGVAGYIIYRDNAEISRTTGTSYRDSGLSAGTVYSYNVKAYDVAGNQSYMSNSVTEFTLASQTTIPVINTMKDTSAPSSPSNVITRSVSVSEIYISWSPSSDNVAVAGYKLFRDGRELTSISGTSFTDRGLSAGSAYSYYVIAFDAAGNMSQQTSYVTEFTQSLPPVTNNNVTPDTQAPSYPPNLNIRAISSSQLEISWSPSTDNVGVAGYIIYRDNAEISRTTGTSYRDSGLSAGTVYSYNVKAYDVAGNQSYMSNSVTEWTLNTTSLRHIKPVNFLSSAINAISIIILGKRFE